MSVATSSVDRLIARLRLVQRDETDDLALRVAQLEHRVRLLESGSSASRAPLISTGGPKQRTLGRLSEIGRVATGTDSDTSWNGDAGTRRRPALGPGTPAAEMLDELGPTFVKFGQVLSTRPDVVPLDIVSELRKLQDDVSPVPLPPSTRRSRRELGLTVERGSLVRRDADRRGSIGQVHRAKLPTGEDVAVKVQRPKPPGRSRRISR